MTDQLACQIALAQFHIVQNIAKFIPNEEKLGFILTSKFFYEAVAENEKFAYKMVITDACVSINLSLSC